MTEKEKKLAKTPANIHAMSFNREIEAPILPAPPSEVGVKGWLYHNIFQSMSDYSSIQSCSKSVLTALFTGFVFYVFATQIYSFIDFAFISAVWSDPDGLKREACWTIEQGGNLPDGWHGACWPYIIAKAKFIMYGAYPAGELWRVNLTYLLGGMMLTWVLVEPLPFRKIIGFVLLVFYPMFATVMLSGGGSGFSSANVGAYTLLGLLFITINRIGAKGKLLPIFNDIVAVSGIAGWALIFIAAFIVVTGFDIGLSNVDTRDWGGLLITLVVATTAIVTSLPLGILLALGRRSEMPIIRSLSIIFIEFWRGVPLITVLFMASVMIPLFMPEGVNFDSLLRALIGVTLWQSAYMAEVIRGGLQAIDKGQYEAATRWG